MVTVKVLRPFRRRGEIVAPGSIIDVPADVLPQLGELVEVLPIHHLVGRRLTEINRQGRPWTGFHGALTAADRQQLRDAEAAVDAAALAGDYEATAAALDIYGNLLAELRRRLH